MEVPGVEGQQIFEPFQPSAASRGIRTENLAVTISVGLDWDVRESDSSHVFSETNCRETVCIKYKFVFVLMTQA